MASGPIPKRVTCPVCKAPEGASCRDPLTYKNVKAHSARRFAAEQWYSTPSPDGLTPRRRDEMVEGLRSVLDRRPFIGSSMLKITTSADPEAEYERILATQRGAG